MKVLNQGSKLYTIRQFLLDRIDPGFPNGLKIVRASCRIGVSPFGRSARFRAAEKWLRSLLGFPLGRAGLLHAQA
jgi:hypothetical protein